ncbi:hypothetical protein VTO58DRAFT_103388 [Aureobasidium pullulans]
METVSSDMTLDPQLKIYMDAQDQQAVDHPLIDATDLPMLWARVEDGSYNIVGALNSCQSKFDNRTLWQRIPIDGTYVLPQPTSPQEILDITSEDEQNEEGEQGGAKRQKTG